MSRPLTAPPAGPWERVPNETLPAPPGELLVQHLRDMPIYQLDWTS